MAKPGHSFSRIHRDDIAQAVVAAMMQDAAPRTRILHLVDDEAAVRRLARIAWTSSPVSAVATWRSPVLLIHGDDDRNVRFSQTVELVQRLRARGVPLEELIIPDDTHHFMQYANQGRVNAAIAEDLAVDAAELG